jgi:enolase
MFAKRLVQTRAMRTIGSRTMATITNVHGRQIIDSRGNPTVEVDVTTEDGLFRASVPSGASTGEYEAVELRDGQDAFLGKGVSTAVWNVNNLLKSEILGKDPADQKAIDDILLAVDGTPSKGKVGANAILGVSLAVAKAGAASQGIPLFKHFARLGGNTEEIFELPVPCFNVINGGEHAANGLAFQEFMIAPTGATSFAEAMRIGCEVFHTLKKKIKAQYGQQGTNVGDEGGFVPDTVSVTDTLDVLMSAIREAGHADSVSICMDAASSEFYDAANGVYDLDYKVPDAAEPRRLNPTKFIDFYEQLIDSFPIVSIEDPFDQNDWGAYSEMMQRLGNRVQIVGDDLLVTNPARIATATEKKACNALLLKVNQIGTVSESIEAVRMSKQAGWGVMTSHRSGETEDNYIADLAVGLCTGQIKTGAPCRGERTAKYNQLLRIEEALGDAAVYSGRNFAKTRWMA